MCIRDSVGDAGRDRGEVCLKIVAVERDGQGGQEGYADIECEEHQRAADGRREMCIRDRVYPARGVYDRL